MGDGKRRDGDGDGRPQVSIFRLATLGSQSGLFGREGDLAWLDACWAEGAHVASVVAFGGVGKSALVWEWLRGMQRDGWRRAGRSALRVYGWSFYSQGTKDQMTSADQFVSAALTWFGDPRPDEGSPWNKGERLARHVKERPTLLVLDGVEPLQWGPGQDEGRIKDPALATLVRELGAQNPGLCLITSRLGVRDAGDLAPEKCRGLDLERLSEEAGAALLRARGVTGEEGELRAAVREYGGHSLALALLGSYLEEVAGGDVRRRGEIGPLEGDERLGGHAQRVMAAYETMLGGGSVEVAILRLLGLFDRPAEEGEIGALRAAPVVPGLTEALAGPGEKEWNRAVAKLRRVGLLARSEGETDRRLDAHPLVREHFGEQVRREREEAWREGHRRLYDHLEKKAKPLPETIEEMAPLFAAVVHGCLAGKNQEACNEVLWKRIERGDAHFSMRGLGAFSSEVAVLSAFFDPPWDRLAAGLSEQNQAWILIGAGYALWALGRLSDGTKLLQQALERGRAREHWKIAATASAVLGEILLARGELSDALAQARDSIELADKSGEAFLRMTTRTARGAVQHAMGRREEAAQQFDEAERLRRQMRPEDLQSLRHFQYEDLWLDQGRYADVRRNAEQTLSDKREYPLLDRARSHLSLGRAHLLDAHRDPGDDLAEAASHLEKAVDGLRRASYQDDLPLGLLARAALHTHTRAFDLARKDLDEALTLSKRCGFRLHEADARLGLARLALALAEGDPTAALGHLAAARAIITETGYHRRDKELADLEAEAATMAKAAPPPLPRPAPLPPAPAPPAPRATAPMTTLQHLDLALVVALPEELRELLRLAAPYTPDHGEGLDLYRFDRGPYRCGVTLVGNMGEAQAARVTERLIAQRSPGSIVVVGVTGGIHDDLRVGDVHVPEQADQYLQNAKVTPAESGGFTVVPGAPAYRANFALLTAVRRFEFSFPEAYQRWLGDARADLATLIPDAGREALFAESLVRPEVKLLADGYVATGPVVGAAAAFSTWIRAHNRNIKSLEMESAAVLLVADAQDKPKRALAIRGISDFGDDRKQALDRLGGGVLRQYAMRNAVRLLFALLDAGAWPREEAKPDPR